MYVKPSAPQSIGGVLDDAIKLFRECLPRCWLLAAAAQTAAALPGLMLRTQIRHWTMADPFAALAAVQSANFLAGALVGAVIFLIFNFALIDNINSVAVGTPASLGRSLGVGIRALPRGFVTAVLIAVIVGFGLVLLIVPGIYWAGTLMLAFTALVVEDAGIWQSLAVSSRLVKGHWWRSATIYSVAIIIALVFYLMLAVTGAAIAAVLGRGVWTAVNLQLLISIAADTFVMVALTATLLAIYRDLHMRHEGAGFAPSIGAAAAR